MYGRGDTAAMTGALLPLVAALALQLEPVPGAPFASPTGPIRARAATADCLPTGWREAAAATTSPD